MQLDELPEFYVTDENQRISAPMYETLGQCQIVMTMNGQTGPTLIEPGEHFSSMEVPNHQWHPLNRAAGERYEEWLASIPMKGDGFSQEEITEAAFAMRPREGEKEIPHEQWWPAVLRYAGAIRDRRRSGLQTPAVRGGVAIRPGAPLQVMPFASQGAVLPAEPGRAPPAGAATHVTQSAATAAQRIRRTKTNSPMPGTLPSESPQQATG